MQIQSKWVQTTDKLDWAKLCEIYCFVTNLLNIHSDVFVMITQIKKIKNRDLKVKKIPSIDWKSG